MTGNRIRKLRESLGYTMDEFAYALGYRKAKGQQAPIRRTLPAGNRRITGVSFRDAASTLKLDARQIPSRTAKSTRRSSSETHSTRAPLKEGREQRKERPTPDVLRPKWRPYAPKSNPGVSGERFSDDSGVAEAGSINSGESFLTLPTTLSTFHAVILSAFFRQKREHPPRARLLTNVDIQAEISRRSTLQHGISLQSHDRAPHPTRCVGWGTALVILQRLQPLKAPDGPACAAPDRAWAEKSARCNCLCREPRPGSDSSGFPRG
jgi:transcriptional regulator with XRE-family HTH domain